MSEQTAVVFDLDGTLIDSVPDIAASVNTMLQGYGLDPLDRDTVQSFVGNGTAFLFSRICDVRDVPEAERDQAYKTFMDTYVDAHELTTIYDGVTDALDRLKSAGCVLGLCTNKPTAPMKSVLAQLGLVHYFDAMIAGDSLEKRKPDPLPLDTTFTMLGRTRQFYVGDSEVDAETAQNAQIDFAFFTGGYHKTTVAQVPKRWSFDHWSELPDLILG